jgi:hypothetical protein
VRTRLELQGLALVLANRAIACLVEQGRARARASKGKGKEKGEVQKGLRLRLRLRLRVYLAANHLQESVIMSTPFALRTRARGAPGTGLLSTHPPAP